MLEIIDLRALKVTINLLRLFLEGSIGYQIKILQNQEHMHFTSVLIMILCMSPFSRISDLLI